MDLQFLAWIQSFHSVTFDITSQVISQFIGSGFVWLLGIACLFLERRRRLREAGLALAFGLAGEVIVVELILKPLVHRPRPFWVETVSVLNPVMSSYSFPSGHVTAITAAAWILSYYFPRTTWLWALVIVLTGWSRIYNGVHWPSDVLGGIVIGGLIGWVTLRLVTVFKKNYLLR